MKRWRRSTTSGGQDVPLLLRARLVTTSPAPAGDSDKHAKMMAPEQRRRESRPRATAVCDVDRGNKYGLIRDWDRSGCVMEHLHLLESRLGAVGV